MTAALGTRTPPRLPDLAAFALVALTVLAGPAVLPRLPAEMVVGWHLGLDGEVSRTVGPRVIGLVALPALSVALFAGALATQRLAALGRRERRLLGLGTTLTLAAVCAAQLWLVWVNL